MIQLRLGHVALNKYLSRIHAVDSPLCDHCGDADETVNHFIFECLGFYEERKRARRSLGGEAYNLENVFSTRAGIIALLEYVDETGRLKHIFGDVAPTNLADDDIVLDEPPAYDDDFDWDDVWNGVV